MAPGEKNRVTPQITPRFNQAISGTRKQPGLRRNLSLQSIYDILFIILIALLVPICVELKITPWLRLPVGLVAVLFAPGYATTEAIFAHRDDHDGVMRLALSLGMSIAGLPLLALILNSLPWGIRLWPIVISITAWSLLASGITIFRRWWLSAVPANTTPANLPPELHPINWVRQQPKKTIAIYTGSMILLLLIGTYFGVLFLRPNPDVRLSEFYALGADGFGENYPREVVAGQEVQLTLGIFNQEGFRGTYRIEVRQQNRVLTELGPISVKAGERWEQPVRYKLTVPGDDQVVDILLFYNNQTAPYRSLRLWINVKTS